MSEAILLPYFIVCRSLTDSESEESDVMITSCSRYDLAHLCMLTSGNSRSRTCCSVQQVLGNGFALYYSNNSWLVSYCGYGPTFGACLTLFSMVVVNVEEMKRENF